MNTVTPHSLADGVNSSAGISVSTAAVKNAASVFVRVRSVSGSALAGRHRGGRRRRLRFGLLREGGSEGGGHGSAGRTGADEESPTRDGVFGHVLPPQMRCFGERATGTTRWHRLLARILDQFQAQRIPAFPLFLV